MSGIPGLPRKAACASPLMTPSAFRTEELTLDSDPWGTALLGPDQVLMELKAPGAIPLWMVRLLTEMRLYKTSFSKYGTAYQLLLEREWKGGKRYA